MKIDIKSLHPTVHFRRVSIPEIIPLRHKELRPGRPIETASFEGDGHSVHYGIFFIDAARREIGSALCCASFLKKQIRDQDAWELRGMVTEYSYQRIGFGRMFLSCALEALELQSPETKLVYCNARTAAVPFYEKLGWQADSNLGKFNLPGEGGWHWRMTGDISMTT